MQIISESRPMARRTYTCDECKRLIMKGDRYRSMYGMGDAMDKPFTLRWCLACDQAHIERYKIKKLDNRDKMR